MQTIKVGDRVEIRGHTQDYVLVDPDRIYTGEVIGREAEQLLVRLDQAVVRGTGELSEVSVPAKYARVSQVSKSE